MSLIVLTLLRFLKKMHLCNHNLEQSKNCSQYAPSKFKSGCTWKISGLCTWDEVKDENLRQFNRPESEKGVEVALRD